MQYRAEIDGLRALAVVPVILFHAGFETFGGGFVGVDVFFVISGFLITSIIIADLEANRFSLLYFYERRARRILPALFFVMFACLPFAWAWMLPSYVNEFLQSIAAVSTFWSNIFFWKESGYFDTAVELKPLLHTWSLAVEEQYYLLFPVFLMLCWSKGRKWILTWLFLIFILSLLSAQWGAYNQPKATFFLLHFRLWELLLGGFVAFYLQFNQINLKRSIRELGSAAGLVLIISAIFAYDEHTPFPSLFALTPTLGTAMLILFATNGTWTNRLLSTPVLVGTGLISYSAYLWHQPIFAFARHRNFTDPSDSLMIVLSLAVFPLAYLSWRFVETPFRQKKITSRKFLAVSMSGLACSLLILSLADEYINFEELWLADKSKSLREFVLDKPENRSISFGVEEGRLDNNDCKFNLKILDDSNEKRISSCFEKYGPAIVILGDSHAIDLLGVVVSSTSHSFIIGITKVGCRPHTPNPKCQYDQFKKFVANNRFMIKTAIFEQAGAYLLTQRDGRRVRRSTFTSVPLDGSYQGIKPDEHRIMAVLKYLSSLSRHVPIIWFGPRIEPHFTKNMVLFYGCEYPYELRKNQREIFETLDDYISTVASNSKVKFVSQNRIFDFNFPSDFMNCEESYWSDGDHFSAIGEAHFGKRLNLSKLLP